MTDRSYSDTEKQNTFVCAACETSFLTDTTEEEKEKEFIAEYGHPREDSDEELFSLCDVCYNLVMEEKHNGN